MKVAILGKYPVIRVETDEGVVGYGEQEWPKHNLTAQVLFYKQFLLGEDPALVTVSAV